MQNLGWIATIPTLTFVLAQPEQPPSDNSPPPIVTGFLYKTVTLAEETYAYSVYVPPSYTPKKAWPVILFLHGSGERGNDGFRQTEVGIGRAIRKNISLFPAIVIMPQCRPEMHWTGPMAQMALKCVEATSHEYHLDPQRVYLTGLSMGGNGTWLLGAQFADRFAALAPICGFAELGQSTGLDAQLAPKLTNIPIWCFHGAADKNVPVSKSREMVQQIRQLGGDIKYTEYEDGQHSIWDRTYKDLEFWKWLYAQRRVPRDIDKP